MPRNRCQKSNWICGSGALESLDWKYKLRSKWSKQGYLSCQSVMSLEEGIWEEKMRS